MGRSCIVACYLLFCTVSLAHAQGSPKSTSAGVFTEDQAKKGEAAYNANCANCHGAELRSGDREVPHLIDRGFKFSWIGKTIAEKFETARDTMPPQDKHSLDDQTYLDIITYVLRFNKIPAGSQRLEPNLDVLKQIVIEAPPG